MGTEGLSCPPLTRRQDGLQTVLEGRLTPLFITASGGLNAQITQGYLGTGTHYKGLFVCVYFGSPTQHQGQVPNTGSLEQHTKMSKIHLAAWIYWRTHKEKILNHLVQILTSLRSWKRNSISEPMSNSDCEWQDEWGFCFHLFWGAPKTGNDGWGLRGNPEAI